ncbi:hypothetical protein ACE450_004465 [Escherichia coli]
MSLKYAHEKFHTAVLTLAGHGSIQERLINSYVFSLGHLKTADDIPNALQSRFDELCKELTKFDATGDEGRVQATVSKLNVYGNAEITSKWHHSCFCQGDLPCLLAMYAYQQMTRTQIYNVMR